jgi:para-aminobenzoate synthetase/4-amino-4-deoxychorismate lyase
MTSQDRPDEADAVHGDGVFVLLDDADASAAQPTSRLYGGFVREHRCIDPATLDAVCAAAMGDLDRGLHGVLLADYEWGVKLLRPADVVLAPPDASCLRILMFHTLRHLDADGAADWLALCEGRPQPAPSGVLDLRADISRAGFESAIARIHEAIRDGETYQVNYTYRMRGRAWGSPVALYRRLRARQRVGFGALMRLPMAPGDTTQWVLSRSPELFVRHEHGRLQARPMKGTAPRAAAPEGDSETARLLHEDIKNRAENLMIVDLLRNDLGRIATIGSVRVPELFRIEPYATVFQMTSAVEAERLASVGLADLLRALFPCGSITGTPKRKTMEWIAALETGPRGLYTGAIGWLDGAPGGRTTCPDMTLSVAIRTVTLGPPERTRGGDTVGARPLVLGVGGGIVHDSVAADEYDETHWKARFLTALDPGIELFETMRATRAGGVAHRERHRARLGASAATLGFAFDAAAWDDALDRLLRSLPPSVEAAQALRVRVALRVDGSLSITHAALPPLQEGGVRVVLADGPLARELALARHKTTARAALDAGVRAAQAEGAFDMLYLDAGGRLLEGGRSNVFLRLGGRWFTPPLADGVMPGVMRGVLLDDPAWAASERSLVRTDLLRAEAIVVCNALRGPLVATLVAHRAIA